MLQRNEEECCRTIFFHFFVLVMSMPAKHSAPASHEFVSTVPDIAAVQRSFTRCMKRASFFDRFYELFMGSHEAIQAKFVHTDMAKQKHLLRHGLSVALMYAEPTQANAIIRNGVERLKTSHRLGGLSIEPWMYDKWLDSLLLAVKETDPEFSPELHALWRKAMLPTIEAMRSGYHAQP